MQPANPEQCKSNKLWKNIPAVSLTELLTLDVIVVGAAAVYLANRYELSLAMMTLLVIAAVVLLAVVETGLGVKSNVGYYLNICKPPHVFKVCNCRPPEWAEGMATIFSRMGTDVSDGRLLFASQGGQTQR